jgi:hypothetical protein
MLLGGNSGGGLADDLEQSDYRERQQAIAVHVATRTAVDKRLKLVRVIAHLAKAKWAYFQPIPAKVHSAQICANTPNCGENRGIRLKSRRF